MHIVTVTPSNKKFCKKIIGRVASHTEGTVGILKLARCAHAIYQFTMIRDFVLLL